MKHFIACLLLSGFASLLPACQSENKDQIAVQDVEIETEEAEVSPNEPPPPPSALCFLAADGRDTTQLQLTVVGDSVEGPFRWIPWQKDGAVGNLKGRFAGDTLRARYDYMIEGMLQAEDKMFIRQGQDLLEMGAELEEVNGMLKPKPGAAWRVQSRLKPVRCSQ